MPSGAVMRWAKRPASPRPPATPGWTPSCPALFYRLLYLGMALTGLKLIWDAVA